MATKGLTEYELQRLENIRRNQERMAALMIPAKVAQLSAATKRGRPRKVMPESKKHKTETPIVLRRSLRTRGMPPDSNGLTDDFSDSLTEKRAESLSPAKPPRVISGPLSMRDACTGKGSDRGLVEAILAFANKCNSSIAVQDEGGSFKHRESEEVSNLRDQDEHGSSLDSGLSSGFVKCEGSCLPAKVHKAGLESSFDVGSMVLEPDHIARIVPGKTRAVKFFPCADMKLIAAGNNLGNVGFLNMDHGEKDGDEIYLYHPHSGPISGIVIQQATLSKVHTSCYDGFIRSMDAEKEIFELVHSSDECIFSLSQQTNNVNNLYFGEGQGGLNVWDLRLGKSSSKWSLHEARINTIDFSPQNEHIMATSSTDGTACLWDLRRVEGRGPTVLKTVNHKRAVHSAYFSPSGRSVATTSFDNKVGILGGTNYEDISMIDHDNQTGRWIPSFRAIWGWDDSRIFIGNMKRCVDVISPALRGIVTKLHSPHMSAIPCRFDAHPQAVGLLAGATGGEKVYVWASSR